MWDWYQRPGRRGTIRTRTAFLIMVGAGFAVGVFFVILYTLITPFVFQRVG